LLAERVAPSVRARIDLHQARYRYTLEESGRVWVTVEGREVASFDTASYVARRHIVAAGIREANGLRPYGNAGGHAAYIEADAQAEDILRRAGEYDDNRALEDLEAYLSMSIEDALASPSPLVRALASVDGRVGKRRLRTLAAERGHHPLVRALLTARCEAEKVQFGTPADRA
jgi:hypothetical protein